MAASEVHLFDVVDVCTLFVCLVSDSLSRNWEHRPRVVKAS